MFRSNIIGLLYFISCVVKYKFLDKLDASTIFNITSTSSFSKKDLDTFSSFEKVSIA